MISNENEKNLNISNTKASNFGKQKYNKNIKNTSAH